ncbi:hypothetical protein SAMN05216553_11715 [Lentzea fradiae]|uniref:Pycsar effector protein domain-containing protein n=1 Tax=Lentzea fradiae TaxID=200378 RepID=A0A1G8A6U7_9PSEU|nr:Pycsar system effector family protein [Lentzea fradiae]SDH16586.1 hypothetical protein SAMN05216553_11715 [Lentzea fradiae]
MTRCEYVAVPAQQHHAEAVTAADLEVRDELRRTDMKAIGMLGLFSVALAALLALIAAQPSTFAAVLLRLAALLVAVSIVLLLSVIRPVGIYSSPYGFPRWACFRGQPAALLDDLTAPDVLNGRLEVLAVLSASLLTKYRRIRAAVHLLGTGFALLTLASFTA